MTEPAGPVPVSRVRAMVGFVSDRTGIPVAQINAPSGQAWTRATVPQVRARFAVIWAARKVTDLSLRQISRHLGQRDYTTIRYGFRRAEELRPDDEAFRELTDALLAAFTPSKTKEHIQ